MYRKISNIEFNSKPENKTFMNGNKDTKEIIIIIIIINIVINYVIKIVV